MGFPDYFVRTIWARPITIRTTSSIVYLAPCSKQLRNPVVAISHVLTLPRTQGTSYRGSRPLSSNGPRLVSDILTVRIFLSRGVPIAWRLSYYSEVL